MLEFNDRVVCTALVCCVVSIGSSWELSMLLMRHIVEVDVSLMLPKQSTSPDDIL